MGALSRQGFDRILAMINNLNSKKQTEIPEYHKLELGEIFQKTRVMETIRIQLGIFIGTVNLSVLGVAFSTDKIGICFIAIGTLFVFVLIDMFVVRIVLRKLYFRGFELENKYSPDPEKSFFHFRLNGSKNKPYMRRLSFAGFWLPVIASLCELALAIYLLFSGWSLF